MTFLSPPLLRSSHNESTEKIQLQTICRPHLRDFRSISRWRCSTGSLRRLQPLRLLRPRRLPRRRPRRPRRPCRPRERRRCRTLRSRAPPRRSISIASPTTRSRRPTGTTRTATAAASGARRPPRATTGSDRRRRRREALQVVNLNLVHLFIMVGDTRSVRPSVRHAKEVSFKIHLL